MTTADNNSPRGTLPPFSDWPVAYLGSFVLHILILYPFIFFAAAPVPLPDLIEISLVFEQPEPEPSLAEQQTTPEQPVRQTEPRLDQTAMPDPAIEKLPEEPAKPELPPRQELAETKILAEPAKATLEDKIDRTKAKDQTAVPKLAARKTPAETAKPKPKLEPKPKPKLESARQPIHRQVPYLDHPVKPAAAGAIRAVRDNEPRMGREDWDQPMSGGGGHSGAAAKAAERYKRAASRGYVMAQYNLGRALAEGSGVEQDSQEAVEFFRNAARQGNVPAMLRLAEMTRTGSKPTPCTAWPRASAAWAPQRPRSCWRRIWISPSSKNPAIGRGPCGR